MSNSPNGLNIASPSVARMSRWPLYAAILGFSIMGAVLIYSVNFAHDPQKEEAKSQVVAVSETESTPLLPSLEKTGGVVGGFEAKPDKDKKLKPIKPYLLCKNLLLKMKKNCVLKGKNPKHILLLFQLL